MNKIGPNIIALCAVFLFFLTCAQAYPLKSSDDNVQTPMFLEIDVAGGYAFSSGDYIKNIKNNSLYSSVSKNCVSGPLLSFLYGGATFKAGIDVGFLQILKYKTSGSDVTHAEIPVMFQLKSFFSRSSFFFNLGGGFSRKVLIMSTNGVITAGSDGTSGALLGGLGWGIKGTTLGMDLGVKTFYFLQSPKLISVLPYLGLTFTF